MRVAYQNVILFLFTSKFPFLISDEAEDYAENLTFQVRKNDEKIAQQDFDMAKMVDFLT